MLIAGCDIGGGDEDGLASEAVVGGNRRVRSVSLPFSSSWNTSSTPWYSPVLTGCSVSSCDRTGPSMITAASILTGWKSFLSSKESALPSVLWHCWLGGRKGIRPVKNWAVGCWHGYLSRARCRLAYGPADSTATHCLLLQENPDWFYLSGTSSPRWSRTKGHQMGVCVCVREGILHPLCWPSNVCYHQSRPMT